MCVEERGGRKCLYTDVFVFVTVSSHTSLCGLLVEEFDNDASRRYMDLSTHMKQRHTKQSK